LVLFWKNSKYRGTLQNQSGNFRLILRPSFKF